MEDFLFYGVLGAIIGGRLGYMFFYGTNQLLIDPLSIIRVWEGGLSFHGGFLGVLTSFFIFSKKLKINFFDLAGPGWAVPLYRRVWDFRPVALLGGGNTADAGCNRTPI